MQTQTADAAGYTPRPPNVSTLRTAYCIQAFTGRLVVGDPLLGRVFGRHAVDVDHGRRRGDLRVGEVHLLQELRSAFGHFSASCFEPAFFR